jgi:DNA-binding beta-propeller fold protein YncE
MADVCGQLGFGLTGARGVAVSPDGKNVYVAAENNRGLVVLNRAVNGSLTYASCFNETGGGGDSQCTAVHGLDLAVSVAVSSDGKSVYVYADDELATFNRNSNGSLVYAGCIEDMAGPNGDCAQKAPGGILGSGSGGSGAVAVTADGKNVYVATQDGGGGNGVLALFSRASGGALTLLGCVKQKGTAETGCAATAPALGGAKALAISRDGFIYVYGFEGIQAFKRAPDGSVTAGPCVTQTAISPCSKAVASGGQAQGNGIALSGDQRFLYTVDDSPGAIAAFARGSGGRLTSLGCIRGTGSSASCARHAATVCQPEAVAGSSDGKDLYVADGCGFVSVFAIGPTGALATHGCIEESGSSLGCGASGNGLKGAASIAISGNDASVYTGGSASDAVAAFSRTPFPETLTVSLAGTGKGRVTGPGISCPKTCVGSYTPGTVVTLVPRPAAGSRFAGWSRGCSGRGTCKVTMNADKSVRATFSLIPPPTP